MNGEFMLYANGEPFHLAGTKIFEEADGTLVYECPHCPCRKVPRKYIEDLRKHARKRVTK